MISPAGAAVGFAVTVIVTLTVTAFLPNWYLATTKVSVQKPDSDVKLFSQQGAEVVASTSPQFAQFLRADYDKWRTLFQKLGIKPE